MIFAQYKHAITFALAMLGLAVVIADPGSDEADNAALATASGSAAPAPAGPVSPPRPTHTIMPADPAWYGTADDGSETVPAPDYGDAGDDADGYAIAPPAPAARVRTSSQPATTPPPAQTASDAAPPPPPPQTFQP